MILWWSSGSWTGWEVVCGSFVKPCVFHFFFLLLSGRQQRWLECFLVTENGSHMPEMCRSRDPEAAHALVWSCRRRKWTYVVFKFLFTQLKQILTNRGFCLIVFKVIWITCECILIKKNSDSACIYETVLMYIRVCILTSVQYVWKNTHHCKSMGQVIGQWGKR